MSNLEIYKRKYKNYTELDECQKNWNLKLLLLPCLESPISSSLVVVVSFLYKVTTMVEGYQLEWKKKYVAPYKLIMTESI